MKRTLIGLLALAVACSPGDAVDSTTSSSSTTMVTPTTTPATTTLPPATTTTSPTTTTLPPPTTTTLVEGNWADGPVVVTEFGALGWWDGAGWLDADTEGAIPVVGGEDYQTIVGDALGRTTAGPQTTTCEPLGLIGVELADPQLLGELPGPFGVAISAPWPLQPHLYEVVTDDGTYAGFASALLAERGLDVPDPLITQLIRTDLEGDGVEEVLAVASDITPGFIMEVGDYSIVFMRKVVDGEVQTSVLDETVVVDEQGSFGGLYSVGTVADLNGDRKMEIVTSGTFFESLAVTVWEYVDDVLGLTLALQMGCGV
ncbi:MAG TPA: hypothetical protein VFP42_08730 [Acidimicrobiia bacterium]|nr:hypothetical protein [Acidimicrobiia bacterium]